MKEIARLSARSIEATFRAKTPIVELEHNEKVERDNLDYDKAQTSKGEDNSSTLTKKKKKKKKVQNMKSGFVLEGDNLIGYDLDFWEN